MKSDLGRSVREVVSWLAPLSARHILERTRAWGSPEWKRTQTALRMHGVAAYLLHHLRTDLDAFEALPAGFRRFLVATSDGLAARNHRLADELAAILALAGRRGLPVMPLKGSLLSNLYYASPAIRPMADIDLLVRPKDERHFLTLLHSLGYAQLKPDSPAARQRHLRLLKPGNLAVVEWELPHADNPRPVEVHTQVGRMLWGDVEIADQSDGLWRDARPITLVGQLALAPTPQALFAHLALHTMDHLALQSARVIQLVDLSIMAARGIRLADGFDPHWIVPALILSRRCMPAAWTDADWIQTLPGGDRHLAAWAARVPLDRRCGLVTDPTPVAARPLRVHWERWRPSPWRLRLAYPGVSLPLAIMRHSAAIARQVASRFRAGGAPA
jgi:hypothetical protein